MPIELVNNTTLQGLFNRLKGLYNVVSRAEQEARDNTNGVNAVVNDIYRRYTSLPQPLGDATTPIIDLYNNRFSSAVSFASEKGISTLLSMVEKEYEIIDNDIRKSLLALIQQMFSSNDSLARPNNRKIEVTAAPNNAGNADILVTDLVPLSWGVTGLTDSHDDNASLRKQVDLSALALYETFDVIATSSENAQNQDIPANFQVVGDIARDQNTDYLWLDGGSGVNTEIRMILPDSEQNMIPNGSFEDVSSVDGPTGWSFFDRDLAWGAGKAWFYSDIASHKTKSLVLTKATSNNERIYANLTRPLEPYKVYFLLFDAYATHTMPSSARLVLQFKDSSVFNITPTQSPVGFYRSQLKIPFGTGAGQIPHNTTNFGTLWFPIVTDNKVLRERTYRIEISSVITDASESWPTNGKVYIDRLVLVPAEELYPMGLKVAIIGGKSNPVRVNDKWVIKVTVTSGSEVYEYWHFVFQHLFNIRSLGLQLPLDDTPTITQSNVN